MSWDLRILFQTPCCLDSMATLDLRFEVARQVYLTGRLLLTFVEMRSDIHTLTTLRRLRKSVTS